MNAPAPTVPVNVGDVLLGKYQVERVIGAGGMGVVVAVRHRELGELYAMKFMLPAALANEQAVDRFVREARAAARLKSEHVAKVHDVGRLENGSPYMVMEYLNGADLEGVLAQQGPLSVSVAATYVMQACDAIAEAHDAGVVHRDLKPANLFLTKRANGSPCIKVLDFGISKSVNPDEAANSMTRTTAIMGSPYYMSPEQMRSSKNVDHRTDIWALGVILYQLSTGRVPFPGETITEVCSGVLADDPPGLGQYLPGMPPEFEQLVRRCLQKRPEHRFGNARELASSLAPIAGASPGTSGLNLQIAGMMPGMQGRPPMQSYPNAPVGAQVPAAPGTMAMQGPPPGVQAQQNIVIPGATTGPGHTRAEFGRTQPPAKKSGAPLVLALLALGGLGAGGYYYTTLGKAAEPAAAAPSATATAAATETAAATAESAPTQAPASATVSTTASDSATADASGAASATPSGEPVAKVDPKPKPVVKGGPAAKPPVTAKPTTAKPPPTGGHGIY